MRDILTVIASLVILVLTAAVAVPPFMDWESQRDLIDQAISRASGTSARTEGAIAVRLLPSPRLQVDELRLGGGGPNAASLDASGVLAEVALTPLLRGEVRFTEARVARASLRVPLDAARGWQVPAELLAESAGAWAIENLLIDQLLLTTVAPSTGRTDQLLTENVTIEGQKLTGPWRVEGFTSGVPFRLVTGELNPDQTVAAKLQGGGDRFPRFDIDAQLALAADGVVKPILSGTARVGFGPPAQIATVVPVPLSVQTAFKTNGRTLTLEQLALEGGDGGAVRLTGSGSIRIDDPRVSLALEGRRIDAEALLLSLRDLDLLARAGSWTLPPVPVPVDLSLSLNSIGLAQEELADVVLRGSLLPDRVRVDQLSFSAPGTTRVMLSGEASLTRQSGASGRIRVTSGASDRLARYLERLDLRSPFLRVLDGRTLDVSTDVSLTAPVTSFSNARLRLGDATVSGSGRYTAPEGGNRGRLEAQLAMQGIDLAQWPQVSSVFEATQHLDIGFTLDARDLRYGPGRSAGRIAARIISDGPTLVVETLDINDLAGANARVSGRIAPDGSGRIAGKVTAQRAAPLVDLIGTVWIGGVSRLVPPFLREGALDLDLVTERAPAAGSGDLRLRTTVRGTAAGGRFEGEAFSSDGSTQNLSVRIATDNTGRWINQPNLASLRRPSNLELRGTRVGSGQFTVTVAGDLGGVRINTLRPFALGSDELVTSGEAEITTLDITPFLTLLGEAAGQQGATPVQARIGLGRERDAALLTVTGRVANEAVEARLAIRSRSEMSGTVTLDRLSMPWLVSALALNAPLDARAPALWSTARFGQPGRLVTRGEATFRVRRLGLGRDLEAENAGFILSVNPDGMALREFNAGFAGARLTGGMSVTRNGAQASVAGEGALGSVPLANLVGPTPFQANVAGNLRFGATADTVAGLVANLGGTGQVQITGLQVPAADPGALARALPRLLAEDDPLAVRRLESVVAEELNRRPLRAPPITVPATLVSGVLRLSPFTADAGPGIWQGVVAFDLKSLTLEARGTLTTRGSVRGWTGAQPFIGVNWRGPLRAPVREVDSGPLNNGLAAIVLQRELEKIEAFEVEGNERQRRTNRLEMDRQRERDRIAAEEAARQARLREEAERRAAEERARVEAERRAAEERARIEAERRAAEERARVEVERRAAEERARIEAERRAAAERARQEAERARQEAERRAAEERARVEAERRAAEERAGVEAERRAAEERARAEADRRVAEERARQDAERQAEAARQAEMARQAELARQAEKARQERLLEEERRRQESDVRPEPSALPPLPPAQDIAPPPRVQDVPRQPLDITPPWARPEATRP